MKRCPKCGVHQDVECFNRDRDGLSSYCKRCQREYCKLHYQRNKALHISRRRVNFKRYRRRNRVKVVDYLKNHPCVDCGEADVRVLDFDHVSNNKSFNISEFVGRGQSWQRIEAEIAKCVVRCANCHRRKTTEQFGWFKGSAGV